MKKALLVKYEYTKRVIVDDCNSVDDTYELMENDQKTENKILLDNSDIHELSLSPDTYLADIVEDKECPPGSFVNDFKRGDTVLVTSEFLSKPAHGYVEEIRGTDVCINTYDYKNRAIGNLLCKPEDIEFVDNIDIQLLFDMIDSNITEIRNECVYQEADNAEDIMPHNWITMEILDRACSVINTRENLVLGLIAHKEIHYDPISTGWLIEYEDNKKHKLHYKKIADIKKQEEE